MATVVVRCTAAAWEPVLRVLFARLRPFFLFLCVLAALGDSDALAVGQGKSVCVCVCVCVFVCVRVRVRVRVRARACVSVRVSRVCGCVSLRAHIRDPLICLWRSQLQQ